jgi:hypothetical protein
LPVVDRLLHPLNVVEAQINEFYSTKLTPQENRQDGSIFFTLHAVPVWKLPQGAGFLGGQLMSKPHAALFCSLHATDSRSQIGAKHSSVRRLIGKPSDGATEVAWLNGNNLEKEEIAKGKKKQRNGRKPLTLTGLLMEGPIRRKLRSSGRKISLALCRIPVRRPTI